LKIFRNIYCESGDLMRKRFRKYRNYKIIILAVAVFVCIFSILTYFWMKPVVTLFAVSTAETIMLNSANESIIAILEEGNVTYEDIVNLSANEEGYVTSLEIDVFQVNNLKSKISNEISKIISGRETYGFGIPIGTFLGNSYTNGVGPKINFKMQITTTAFVDFSHEFKSAGINQVLHIINVDITVKANLIVAGYNKNITVSTKAIAAQTVIVGKSPDAFTNVLESQSDNTGGLINDYGAIVE